VRQKLSLLKRVHLLRYSIAFVGVSVTMAASSAITSG